MIRRPPRSTRVRSSAASDVYKRQRDLRCAGNDLARIPDRGYLDYIVDVVALDLPWNAGERNETVGHDDDPVRVKGICQGKTQRTAGRFPMGAVGVAEHVCARCGDHGDVDVDFAVIAAPCAD